MSKRIVLANAKKVKELIGYLQTEEGREIARKRVVKNPISRTIKGLFNDLDTKSIIESNFQKVQDYRMEIRCAALGISDNHEDTAKAANELRKNGMLIGAAYLFRGLDDSEGSDECIAELERKDLLAAAFVQHHVMEDDEKAAEYAASMEDSKRFISAANIYIMLGRWKDAALAYERSGNFEYAALAYHNVRDHRREEAITILSRMLRK